MNPVSLKEEIPMNLFGAIVQMIICGLVLLNPQCGASDAVSAFPWEKGNVFIYQSHLDDVHTTEQGEIKKIKQKKGYVEHAVDFEIITGPMSFEGTFELDEKGGFHGCSGSMQSKNEPSTINRVSAVLKNNEITITSTLKDDAGEGTRISRKFENISDDTWIMMDGVLTLAMYLALETLEPGYDKIQPFFILNFVTKDRRSGKLRIQVTGEETIDFKTDRLPVYTLNVTAPKQAFTLNPADKNTTSLIRMWVSKADRKLIKVVGSDLKIDMGLVH
jgi:hypothetical protein